ncbi:MAG: PEP-utilizing enzyme [Rudaea sp.]
MSNENDIFWTAGFLNERFPAPVSPLGWSIVGPLFDEYALRDPLRFMGYRDADRIPATRLVQGHPYANVLIFQILYRPFPDAVVPADAIRYFPDGNTDNRKRAPYPSGLLDPRLIGSLLGHFVRDPLNWSPLNYRAWGRYTHEHDRRVDALKQKLAAAETPDQIQSIIAGADRAHADLLRIHRWSLTYADISYRLIARYAGERAQELLADVPNFTAQANADLLSLGKLASRLGFDLGSNSGLADAQANHEFSAALSAFLNRHGHRSFGLDIALPTFAEEPSLPLNLIARDTQPNPHPDTERAPARNQVRSSVPTIQRPLFDLVLALARRYASLREDQRYYWHKSLAVTRRAYLKLASLLAESGDLDSTADIFFLTRSEIESHLQGGTAAGDLREKIAARRAEYAAFDRAFSQSPATAYPAFLKGDDSLETARGEDSNAWQGRGVSPGLGRGRVRVILQAANLGQVNRGDVLVAPATDPGWTPVFGRLNALVMERGGVLAHGAIVAREHHLPAVAGIPNITRELKDGDQVEVDGSNGTVKKIS